VADLFGIDLSKVEAQLTASLTAKVNQIFNDVKPQLIGYGVIIGIVVLTAAYIGGYSGAKRG
jgi:hypothetical protein